MKGDEILEGYIKYVDEGFFHMSECNNGALYAIELLCELNMDENSPKLVKQKIVI